MPFNPADRGPNITLSNGNLTATDTSGGGWASVRSTLSRTSGKWAWRVTWNTFHGFVGVANASAALNTFLGANGNGIGLSSNGGQIFFNGSSVGGWQPSLGNFLLVLLDLDNGRLSLLPNGTSFPSTENIDISSISGPIFPAVSVGFNGVLTMDENPTGLPAGYTAIGAGGGTSATANGATVTSSASIVVGTASGQAGATAAGVTLSRPASLIPGGASGEVIGLLNFQAAGLEFGRRTGLAISTFALDAGASYRYTVHANTLTLGAAILTSSAINLDAAGKLPNLSSALITPGTTYRIVAIRQADGEAAIFRMTAA